MSMKNELGAKGNPGATNNPADRITALEEALRELNEALDAFWNDPHRIYKTHDERHRKAITAAQVKSRRALGAEGETP